MARNRQRAKERQARRKAKGGGDGAAKQPRASDPNAAKPGPTRRQGDDPIADDVLDELERESVVAAGADPATPPPLSESERLRAGAPPEDVGSSAEVLDFEQDLEADDDPHHFDPAQDVPEEDLSDDGKQRRKPVGEHKDRPRFVQFLVAVWAELQRVQWPDRQAMTTLTGVVLGFVLIAGGYLGLLDAIASRVIQAIL
ncbi:MAG TPA: preprotein translocase subunit SecE [Thermoleophilaceae bacterium]|nr:preprotein translocase subunit SecE [Thermoleophilaceae bacterium]